MLAGVPTLCCTTADVPSASIKYEGQLVVVDLAQAPHLLQTGSAGQIVDEKRKLNILIAHTEKKRFVVLNRTCTHGGGPVAYSHKRRSVQCTCWGHTEFTMSGSVMSGPAKKPLKVYEARLTGKTLEIKLEPKA